MKKFRVSISILLVVVFGLGYYFYLSYRDAPTPAESQSEVSEIGKLMAKDLDADYPNTPRKVIDLYSQITKSLYIKDLPEEDLKKLCNQSRKLFDVELLNANPEDEFLENTKKEIKEYNDKKRVITSYVLEDSDSVDYYTEDGQEYAAISVKYFLNDKNGYGKTYEDFLLRKDEKGRWKILGWQITPANEEEDE